MLSSKLLLVIITFLIFSSFFISIFISATTEPVPFEVDFDIEDDEDDHVDSDPRESYSPFNPGDDLEEAGRSVQDIIRKNLGKVYKTHNRHYDKSSDDLNLNIPKGGQRMKMQHHAKHSAQSTDIRRRKRVQSNHVCPDDDAPKVGDRVFIHIPSREHLVPRFTGMRVFAPPHAEYHKDRVTGAFRDNKHIHDHHFGSKWLYVFDEHVIQGIWPVHDMVQHHRDLKMIVKDVHVQEDPKGNHEQLCYFKVAPQ